MEGEERGGVEWLVREGEEREGVEWLVREGEERGAVEWLEKKNKELVEFDLICKVHQCQFIIHEWHLWSRDKCDFNDSCNLEISVTWVTLVI